MMLGNVLILSKKAKFKNVHKESEFWNYTYLQGKKTTKENTTKDSLW